MITTDGAFCDRCGIDLEGYGILFGLVCSDLAQDSQVRELIYCYDCRDEVLAGMLTNVTNNRKICTACGAAVIDISDAMMCADIDPETGSTRFLAFCYVNGHRDQILEQGMM